jgi:hypothetical protein
MRVADADGKIYKLSWLEGAPKPSFLHPSSTREKMTALVGQVPGTVFLIRRRSRRCIAGKEIKNRKKEAIS